MQSDVVNAQRRSCKNWLPSTRWRKLDMERELAALRDELEAAEAGIPTFSLEGSERATEDLNLAGLTILYVGGRAHQVTRLKSLVERASGQFVHHDGGLEEQGDLLPGLVS